MAKHTQMITTSPYRSTFLAAPNSGALGSGGGADILAVRREPGEPGEVALDRAAPGEPRLHITADICKINHISRFEKKKKAPL